MAKHSRTGQSSEEVPQHNTGVVESDSPPQDMTEAEVQADWDEVIAIDGPKGSMSVKELEDLRDNYLSPTALGVGSPEELAILREQRAQELVDALLPIDMTPVSYTHLTLPTN
jgi:hypothetical protein